MGHLLMSVPCGLGITCTRQPDERVRLRGADGKALQGYGTRQFWLKVGALKKQCEFYVTDVAKVILRVSSLCKSGTEAHINRQLLLGGYDEDCEPLVQHHGVCFVKIQTVIGATIKKREVNVAVEDVVVVASGELKKNGVQSSWLRFKCNPLLQTQMQTENHPDTGPWAKATPVPCDPSEIEKDEHSLIRIPCHGAKYASEEKNKQNHTE